MGSRRHWVCRILCGLSAVVVLPCGGCDDAEELDSEAEARRREAEYFSRQLALSGLQDREVELDRNVRLKLIDSGGQVTPDIADLQRQLWQVQQAIRAAQQ